MNTYWHRHPRNFANECIPLRAANADEARRLEALGFTRLTRDEMQRHLAWMNEENAAWGSNRAVGYYSFADLLDNPDTTAMAYLAEIDREAEMRRREEAYWLSEEPIRVTN